MCERPTEHVHPHTPTLTHPHIHTYRSEDTGLTGEQFRPTNQEIEKERGRKSGTLKIYSRENSVRKSVIYR